VPGPPAATAAPGTPIYGIGGGSILALVLIGSGRTPSEVVPAALASTFVISVAGVITFTPGRPLLQRHHDRVVLVALCQFLKAKVVRHICQKLVSKKCRENISSIRRAPSACSDSASSRISSIGSRLLNPVCGRIEDLVASRHTGPVCVRSGSTGPISAIDNPSRRETIEDLVRLVQFLVRLVVSPINHMIRALVRSRSAAPIRNDAPDPDLRTRQASKPRRRRSAPRLT
jgi:hypothetical protein